jgi:hypothetical protein
MFKTSFLLALFALPLFLALPACQGTCCGYGATAQTLCGDCGQVKGTTECCDAKAERCDCGMIKGSPGCCQ